MKDGSQAAVRACKCPPSAPARDMERDNTPMWAHWAPGDHHHWRASTSSPSINPSLCSFFAIFAIFSTMCAMQVYGGLPGMSGAPGPKHDTFVTIAETESGTKAWS